MSLNKMIKRERKQKYKRLRKLRKARDMASRASKNKAKPCRLSMVNKYFTRDIDYISVDILAHSIYKHMLYILTRPNRAATRKR